MSDLISNFALPNGTLRRGQKMITAVTRGELNDCLKDSDRGNLGFVPTMGALHRGHIALVDRARRENGTVGGSILVNPTPGTEPEELQRYPRTTDA